MIHLTLNTGHSRVSPRHEVTDQAIAASRAWLAPGDYRLPIMGYRLVVPACHHGYGATVYRGETPLVTFGAADSAEAAAEIWPPLEGMYLGLTDSGPFARADFRAPKMPDSLPWLAAVVTLAGPGEDWIGDMERCIAWAWLESRR